MNATHNAIKISEPKDISIEALPYKYPMRSAVTLDAELRQIKDCVAQKFQRVMLQGLKQEWCSVVGYGPSLRDTWKDITHPCVTVSGAHDFLVACGVVPDFHVECDGREHKTKHLENPQSGCAYLMASICNPRMWELLKGHDVRYWHNANGMHVVNWIYEHDRGSILVAGGSVVGLSAIHIMGLLGYRKFRLFGFDGNFREGARHAGPHFGPPQKVIDRKVGGKVWKTTRQMSNACDEFTWLRDSCDCEFEVVGDGLLKAMLDTPSEVVSWR